MKIRVCNSFSDNLTLLSLHESHKLQVTIHAKSYNIDTSIQYVSQYKNVLYIINRADACEQKAKDANIRAEKAEEEVRDLQKKMQQLGKSSI